MNVHDLLHEKFPIETQGEFCNRWMLQNCEFSLTSSPSFAYKIARVVGKLI